MVSGACGGDDIRSGLGIPLTLVRRSAKCAAPRRAWRPEVLEGGCSPAADSPGRSKVGRSKTTLRSVLNIIRIVLTRSRQDVGAG